MNLPDFSDIDHHAYKVWSLAIRTRLEDAFQRLFDLLKKDDADPAEIRAAVAEVEGELATLEAAPSKLSKEMARSLAASTERLVGKAVAVVQRGRARLPE